MLDWSEYSRFTVSLFAILTPFAAIPIYLSLTDGRSEREKAMTATAAVLTVFVVLGFSAFAGDAVLRLVGANLDSFRVGGGIVLLLMALSMLNARVSPVQHTESERDEAERRDAVGVVPLGLPLLAGPGAISSVILEAEKQAGWPHLAAVAGCILAVCLVLWASLRLADPIGRRLGRIGLNILNRLFGLLLAAVAVEIIATGLKNLLPGLAR